ncbi:hypothetical protein JOB18_036257 [Solea senegalensis]|uniref:MYND-type domain-containing protein n=1 Tax=Solea senegalensis TaxID=28829 RepID=A0AAV6STX5_SOLSE|nr:zinc finger MYND domain-containing protein 12 [Solea senegalensis]KAG7520809.1 hypothetical protein JOB18_036257 [Solea senegalensis]
MEEESQLSATTSRIIPLALPKGTEKVCELCQRRAKLQCNKCRVTFYCDAEHQQADWVGIHGRICQLLIPIRSTTLYSLQGAEHLEMQLKKTELIEICRLEAQRKLSERKHYEALPAAQFCLRCSTDVHGPCTVQVVPAYLLLAEANMGLGNLGLVAELLSQVEWVVLKSPDCGHTLHRQLHRSLGLLHTVTGNLEAALFNFANDIYFASEEYGPESTVTCQGYFLMANVFAKQGKMTITHSLYSTVTQTWHVHLSKLVQAHVQNAQTPCMLLEHSYDKSQHAEVDEMLRTILEFEEKNSTQDSGQIAVVTHCLAMLWFLRGDNFKVSPSLSPLKGFRLTQ